MLFQAALRHRAWLVAVGLMSVGISMVHAEPDARYLVERPVKRLALIIANWDYSSGRLEGTDVDQTTFAEQLKEFGFEVDTISNFRTQDELVNGGLNKFLNKIKEADFALIYYSGHGLSFGSENFPVPTKLPGTLRESDLSKYFVSIEEFHRKLAEQNPGISMVILDACRTYTGPKIEKSDGSEKELPKGLIKPSMRMTTNMALIYAAEPGQTATVKGKQSIFTEALVESLKSGLNEYNEVKRDVNSRVLEKSGEKQLPWYNESPTAMIWFRDSEESRRAAKTAWLNAVTRGTIDDVKRFLRMFPSSSYSIAAREWLRDNPEGTAVATSKVPPTFAALAWEGSTTRIAYSDVSAHYSFANTVALAKVGGDFSVDAMQKPTRDQIANTMVASSALVTNRPINVRSQPSSSGKVLATLPRGALLRFSGTTTDASGQAWLEARVRSVDGPVYVEPPPAFKAISTASIGVPLVEGLISPNPETNSVLVREIDVYKLIASAGDGYQSISWASIESGAVVCKGDGGQCHQAEDLRSLRALHAESLLVQAGVDRKKITSVSDASGVPAGLVRIRFFR